MKHDLSSLRLLGTVGEPINPEAWMWYQRVIGNRALPHRRHVVADRDGRIMMTPMPGAIPPSPAAARSPSSACARRSCAKDGTEAGPNEGGFLVVERPWPSIMRTVWGDDERFRDTYYTRFQRAASPGRSTSPATARAATSTATSG
jgi:acetyl-CoA synthetase